MGHLPYRKDLISQRGIACPPSFREKSMSLFSYLAGSGFQLRITDHGQHLRSIYGLNDSAAILFMNNHFERSNQ